MSSGLIDFDPYERAIVAAFRSAGAKHPEGTRYIQLHRESKINGKQINIKTFDKHLKMLVNLGVVIKIPKGRSKVFYKLRPTQTEEESRRFFEKMRELSLETLTLFYNVARTKKKAQGTAQEELEKYISYELNLVKFDLVMGLALRQNSVEFSLLINEITHNLQKYIIEVNRLMHENHETWSFFEPLLTGIMKSMSSKINDEESG